MFESVNTMCENFCNTWCPPLNSDLQEQEDEQNFSAVATYIALFAAGFFAHFTFSYCRQLLNPSPPTLSEMELNLPPEHEERGRSHSPQKKRRIRDTTPDPADHQSAFNSPGQTRAASPIRRRRSSSK